jgi:hypothetical protein
MYLWMLVAKTGLVEGEASTPKPKGPSRYFTQYGVPVEEITQKSKREYHGTVDGSWKNCLRGCSDS